MRIEDERRWYFLLVQPIEEMIDQGGLTCTDFAGQKKQSFTILNTVSKLVQRFLNAGGSVQKPGVGVYVERILAKSKETFAHGCVITAPGPSCRILAVQLLEGGPS
jgi:hypothetical protein